MHSGTVSACPKTSTDRPRRSCSTATRIAGIPSPSGASCGCTSRDLGSSAGAGSIATSGYITMGQYLPGSTSITSMAIHSTTRSRILQCCLSESITKSIGRTRNANGRVPTFTMRRRQPKNGMAHPRVAHGILSMQSDSPRNDSLSWRSAWSAMPHSMHFTKVPNFAATLARPSIAATLALTTSSTPVAGAGPRLRATSMTAKQSSALALAQRLRDSSAAKNRPLSPANVTPPC